MAFVACISSRMPWSFRLLCIIQQIIADRLSYSQLYCVEACAYTSMAFHGQACPTSLVGALFSNYQSTSSVPESHGLPIITAHAFVPAVSPLVRSGVIPCVRLLPFGPWVPHASGASATRGQQIVTFRFSTCLCSGYQPLARASTFPRAPRKNAGCHFSVSHASEPVIVGQHTCYRIRT